MNKKKLLILSIPVVLGGVLLYFLTRGKGKGKQKEKEQKGDGTHTTTTTTSTGGGKLSNNFTITKLCTQYESMKNGDYLDTKVPDDWDLYVVSLKDKKLKANIRELAMEQDKSELQKGWISYPSLTKKGKYDSYWTYGKDYTQGKDGDVFVASNGLRHTFRKLYLRKLDSENIKGYGIFETNDCTNNDPYLYRATLKDNDYRYMDKSLLKPLKEVDPERYQQELQKIKNQIANRNYLG